MPVGVLSVVVSGIVSPPGQVVTLRDLSTGLAMGSAVADGVTGAWSIAVPFSRYVAAEAAGAAAALGQLQVTDVGVTSGGGAGGQGAGAGNLTQKLPLGGAGAGQAAGAGPVAIVGGTINLQGGGAGQAAGAGPVGVTTPGVAVQGGGAGQGAGAATLGVGTPATDAITSPTEGATGVSSPVTITGTASTGQGATAELWDGGLVPVKTATASSNATTSTCTVVIPASAGSPVPAGSIVVVCLGHGSDGGGAQAVTGMSGSSLGALDAGHTYGGMYARGTIYFKVVGAAITADETITITHAAAVGTGTRTISATVLTGQHASPAGATAGGANLSPAAVSVTPQAAGSIIFVAMGNDGANGVASTPNANTTILYESQNGSASMGYVARSTNLTPNTSAISIGSTKTGTSNNFAALEIKAA